MATPATTIILVAGGVTFTGEWYWSQKIDWKVPLATVLLAAGAEGLSAVDRNGATLLAIMVALGAFTTKYNGHSAIDMVTALIHGGKNTPTNPPSKTPAKTGGVNP